MGENSSECAEVAVYMEIRFPLVLLGFGVAIVSAAQNTILLYMFLSRKELRRSQFLHLAFLALCDIIAALSYIAIMVVQVLMERYESSELSRIWHSYLVPVFTFSHVALVASTYVIITATLERYFTSLPQKNWTMTPGKRILLISIAIFFAVLLKGSMLFELKVKANPNCTNHNVYSVVHTELALDESYSNSMFLTRHILVIFLPFALLAYLNVSIVRTLRAETNREALNSPTRKEIRGATRSLIVVVTCYLAANLLNVVISFWEHIDHSGLHSNHEKFTALSVDITSILAITVAAVRLEVYAWTSRLVRRELKALKDNCWTNIFGRYQAEKVTTKSPEEVTHGLLHKNNGHSRQNGIKKRETHYFFEELELPEVIV